ncbi:MAG: DUF4334 domain-containing protein [Mesorhizobium sp.]|nr:MAG: DUF4334 domain-containing protein [Mesorhizobium sp.]
MPSRRGKRAALMYDRQAIIDHLRTINDRHRLGSWTCDPCRSYFLPALSRSGPLG